MHSPSRRVNVPIGAILIPLVLVRTTESRSPAGRLDLAGLLLVSAGMLGVVWVSCAPTRPAGAALRW
jgi:hypothetical protein